MENSRGGLGVRNPQLQIAQIPFRPDLENKMDVDKKIIYLKISEAELSMLLKAIENDTETGSEEEEIRYHELHSYLVKAFNRHIFESKEYLNFQRD